jgi:hypothetical protein
MTRTPIGDQVEAEAGHPYPPAPQPGSTVAVRFSPAELDQLLSPHTVSPVQWIRSLMAADELPDSDPDEMALGMMASILMAETSEEALAALDLSRALELCGGKPGGRSPALEIFGARPLKSTMEDGAPCYAIVSAVRLDTGEKIRFTTGARAVQTVIAKHVYEGWIPFKAALEIRREATARGFHPLNLVGGI